MPRTRPAPRPTEILRRALLPRQPFPTQAEAEAAAAAAGERPRVMPDSTRPTLRLRLPPSLPTEPRRPAGTAPVMQAPLGRPAAYVAPRRAVPQALEPCSRAILQELAALGLVEPEES